MAIDKSTIIATVRRRSGITQDRTFQPDPNTTMLDLGVGGVYALPLVAKNGTTLTAGVDYTWNTYSSYVTLTAATDVDDVFFVTLQKAVSDEVVNETIAEAEDLVVRPALRPLYAGSALDTSPTVKALVTAHAVGRLRQYTTAGRTLEDPNYRSGWEILNEVKAMLTAIMNGSMGILDTSGDEVARAGGSVVGSFIHPDGKVTGRLNMIDRAQKWRGVIQHYWPETDPADIEDVRNLA